MLPPSIRRINIVAACKITIRWICGDPWLSFQSCWFLTYVRGPALNCMEYFRRPVCKHFLLIWSVCSSPNDNVYLQVMAIDKVTQFENVDYDTRATSLALESHCARSEDVFFKVGIRFLESNIKDERGRLCTLVIKCEMIPMGHIMRQSTSECRVSILCCRPSRYTYLPDQTQTTRDC